MRIWGGVGGGRGHEKKKDENRTVRSSALPFLPRLAGSEEHHRYFSAPQDSYAEDKSEVQKGRF